LASLHLLAKTACSKVVKWFWAKLARDYGCNNAGNQGYYNQNYNNQRFYQSNTQGYNMNNIPPKKKRSKLIPIIASVLGVVLLAGGGFYFYTELFPALMQGNQVEESVLAALDRINARINEFDVVVIIRGGGATSDLSGFDTYLLAAACAQFPLPIITGIGHERDDTVLDSVAHTRVKTPTAAAELLIHQVTEVAEHLEELSVRLQQGAYMLLEQEQRRLEALQIRIPNLVHRKLADARFSLLAAKKDLSQVAKALLARRSHRLELLQQRIADASPDKLLSRGYSITIKDGKAVTDASSLKPGDRLTTRLLKGEVQSVVEK